ncbi:MAG: sulfur carrier protein ThiS [Acidobacteriota bacterium]
MKFLHIHVNGELREVDNDLSLPKLVSLLNLKPEQIAIELNKTVVRRAQWENIRLREADQVEIVHFVGGGSDSYPQITQITTVQLRHSISKSN